MKKREINEAYFDAMTVRVAESGCQIWMGRLSSKGYGTLKNGDKLQRAHRTNWEFRNGPIPDGVVVFHRCQVHACVNPDHLFLSRTPEEKAVHAQRIADLRAAGVAWPKIGAELRITVSAAIELAAGLVTKLPPRSGPLAVRTLHNLAYQERFPEKRRAHKIVEREINAGRLVRAPCEHCGTDHRVQAHHEDYSQPLAVTWLCPRCHGRVHRQQRSA